MANLLWGSHFTDVVFGMFLVQRQRFLDLRLTSNGFAIESQCMARAMRCGYKIKEIPVVEQSRLTGRSHLSIFRDGWYIGSTVFAEFFHALKENPRRRPALERPEPSTSRSGGTDTGTVAPRSW